MAHALYAICICIYFFLFSTPTFHPRLDLTRDATTMARDLVGIPDPGEVVVVVVPAIPRIIPAAFPNRPCAWYELHNMRRGNPPTARAVMLQGAVGWSG